MKREKEKKREEETEELKWRTLRLHPPSAADGSSSGEPPASGGQRSSNFRKTSSDWLSLSSLPLLPLQLHLSLALLTSSSIKLFQGLKIFINKWSEEPSGVVKCADPLRSSYKHLKTLSEVKVNEWLQEEPRSDRLFNVWLFFSQFFLQFRPEHWSYCRILGELSCVANVSIDSCEWRRNDFLLLGWTLPLSDVRCKTRGDSNPRPSGKINQHETRWIWSNKLIYWP